MALARNAIADMRNFSSQETRTWNNRLRSVVKIKTHRTYGENVEAASGFIAFEKPLLRVTQRSYKVHMGCNQ